MHWKSQSNTYCTVINSIKALKFHNRKPEQEYFFSCSTRPWILSKLCTLKVELCGQNNWRVQLLVLIHPSISDRFFPSFSRTKEHCSIYLKGKPYPIRRREALFWSLLPVCLSRGSLLAWNAAWCLTATVVISLIFTGLISHLRLVHCCLFRGICFMNAVLVLANISFVFFLLKWYFIVFICLGYL